ncbi:MAG: GNAT family N-acetyltransferase [Planctomycetes bacterium]|nr:GNAT family N-acetyltransferase [Planctomycetota bacterium]
MLHIRTMTATDVALGMRLRYQAGFNQTEADWRRFLDLAPDGCFVAELDGEPVGTVANFVFDAVGWIAMLLVDRRVRGRGIGTRLTEHALEYLDARGCGSVRLDATPRGRPVYEKLGFMPEYELARREGPAGGGTSHESVSPVAEDHLDVVVELDRRVTGTNRRRLIERLYLERPDAMHVVSAGNRISGYVTFRDGSHATQIGPAVALDEEAGRMLADAAIHCCSGRFVFIDVPVDNTPAVRWAESNGLEVERPFTRMRRGRPVVDNPRQLWASSGPEKG